MRKVKGYTLLLMMLMVLLLSTVIVSGVTPKVFDKAQLFSSQELEDLERLTSELSEVVQLDIAIVTTADNEGKSSRDYADDFYDQNGFGYGPEADGLLLLINMEDREVYISTCGKAIQYFTDARIENILDQIYTSLGDGHYYDAAVSFLNQVEYYVEIGIPQNQNTQYENNGTSPSPGQAPYYNNAPQRTELTMGQKILIYLVASFAVGGVAVLIMALNNKGISTANQRTYLKNQALDIYNRQDQHVDTQVTFVTIQTNNNSGGGTSSTHRSSSGRTHGGGGRKF